MTSDIYDGLSRTNLALKGLPKEHVPENPDIEQLLEIMTQYGFQKEVVHVVAKHVMRSVLGDFVEFIYESLGAIMESRFSVAYTLLRKPFVDELFIFEQILLDKEEFVQRYYFQGDTELYDPGNNKRFAKVKKSIIEAVIEKLPDKSWFNANTVYEFRYDKSVKYGINWISNQAIHIVTSDSNYKTLNRNLNFVFSVQEDFEKYWAHYYSVVLYLLFYAIAVVDEVVFGFLPEQIHEKHIRGVKRTILMSGYNSITRQDEEPLENLTGILADELAHTCKTCETAIEFTFDDFQLFVVDGTLNCPTCHTNQLTDQEFKDKFIALE